MVTYATICKLHVNYIWSHTHTYCGMGVRDANISPGMRDDNSSPYICEIIYICEMGKRDDNIHMKRYCNVYVYIWASVYIGLCLCVHICILIAGSFTICTCEVGLSFLPKVLPLHCTQKHNTKTSFN